MTLESAIRWLFVDALLRHGVATFDDVRLRIRILPSYNKNRLGSIPRRMHEHGLIVPVAAVASKLSSRRGSYSTSWRLVNLPALKRIYVEHAEADLGAYLAEDPQFELFSFTDEEKTAVDAGGVDHQTLPLGENGVICRNA
ncbi:hypothetical protein [Poriferisphaera sp. WC338]|uniref:hypothetical protein n=1 Tax=Poriferisphaera sp. WC338 TaxID=3425129 RepID=UPI003D812EFD